MTLPQLPRELWLMILKIKTKKAIYERIESSLKFPTLFEKGCSQNSLTYRIEYTYLCGRLRWMVSEKRSRHDNYILKIVKVFNLQNDKISYYHSSQYID